MPSPQSQQGFYARPRKEGDSLNLLIWDVGIPGKEGVRVVQSTLSSEETRLD
jgi:hypothetical protein